MATKTTNYGLTKPDETDFYDIGVHNENADIIDTQLSKLSGSITSHTGNKSNPHGVTKEQVGLENVENKSSATIRGELTKTNVTTALGYTPPTSNTWRGVQNNLTSDATDQSLSAAQGKVLNTSITGHTGNKSNPHGVTKAQVGLGSVENKSSATIRGELTKTNVTTALGYTPPTTNSWRGIQNNLTSDSTTDSLSAAQGKVLNDKITQLNSDKTWIGTRGTILHKIGNIVFCTISQILDSAVGNHVYQNVFLDAIPDGFRPNNNVYSAFAVVSGGYYIGNGYINVKTDGSNEAILSTSRSQNAEYNLTLTWICK